MFESVFLMMYRSDTGTVRLLAPECFLHWSVINPIYWIYSSVADIIFLFIFYL